MKRDESMTDRELMDRYAGLAMQAIRSNDKGTSNGRPYASNDPTESKYVAEQAWDDAEAMMLERHKRMA